MEVHDINSYGKDPVISTGKKDYTKYSQENQYQ